MATIGIVIDVVLKIVMRIFGMDKPAETDVRNEKPATPIREKSDAEILQELGVKRGPQK